MYCNILITILLFNFIDSCFLWYKTVTWLIPVTSRSSLKFYKINLIFLWVMWSPYSILILSNIISTILNGMFCGLLCLNGCCNWTQGKWKMKNVKWIIFKDGKTLRLCCFWQISKNKSLYTKRVHYWKCTVKVLFKISFQTVEFSKMNTPLNTFHYPQLQFN